MTYLSLFSGIEAASSAWHPLGWTPVAFSEIEPFPCAVLAHHHPDVPNYGDVTKHKDWPHADVDVVVGGSPCQAFSVAGLRKGLDDPRGNLTLTYLAVVEQYRPRWVVWENVPGVLSIDGGRVFGAFLGALGKLGYGFAYRVLDAQYVRVESHPRAVPQRRRRVFVVGYLGDWRRAAAVLFERESLQRNTPPRREAGKGVAADVAPCVGASGRGFERTGETRGQDPVVVSGAVTSKWSKGSGGPSGDECQNLVAASYDMRGRGDGETVNTLCTDHASKPSDYCPVVVSFDCKASGQNGFGVGEVASTMRSMGHSGSHQNGGGHQAVAFDAYNQRVSDVTHTLRAGDGVGEQIPYAATSMHVRRLTPRECERLQGFPDDYTLVPYRGKPAADGPRYKALGNSMAVNVMRWIGERIQMVEEL